MIHKGKILEETVKRLNPNITDLSEKLDTTRAYIYRLFKKEDVSDEWLRHFAMVLDYDFEEEFPGLMKGWVLREQDQGYQTAQKELESLKAEYEKLKEKYFLTLEQVAELQRENAELKGKKRSNVSQ